MPGNYTQQVIKKISSKMSENILKTLELDKNVIQFSWRSLTEMSENKLTPKMPENGSKKVQ